MTSDETRQPGWPRVTLSINDPRPGLHRLEVDGVDIGPACRRAELRVSPGCWPQLALELNLTEVGSIQTDGVEIVLPPETRHALKRMGWSPPAPPGRPDA